MKNYKFRTAFVTLYLVFYTVMLRLEISITMSLLMFSISPFLVVCMVYTMLKYAPYNGRELKDDEEYEKYNSQKTNVSIQLPKGAGTRIITYSALGLLLVCWDDKSHLLAFNNGFL